jgi:hypothetical protein
LDNGLIPLKKTFISLLFGSFFFLACKKENFIPAVETQACEVQTDNPTGRSYAVDSVVEINYSKKHCGLLPLSRKNYWVYEDSVFNNGVFARVQYDTLRYVSTYESFPDKLIWWKSNISVGLPEKMYVNDSTFFEIQNRMFTPGVIDAKKDYGLFTGDSVRYLASFEDAAAQGRSLKLQSTLSTPAGNFNDCLLFEKNARNYRKDQVYFKPGVGVIKYIVEKAPLGTRITKLQQVSTLIDVHIE